MMRTIGRLLRRVRASESASPLADPELAAEKSITVTSPSFGEGESIPRLHAGPGVGENVSPRLHWSEVPAEARHLVVLMDDVDVPLAKPLIHTVALIEPDRTSLGEGELVRGTAGVRIIATRLSRDGYSGPRPIPGHGPHRYRFHVLAVARRVPDDVTSSKALMRAIAGQVIARGTLTGTYER